MVTSKTDRRTTKKASLGTLTLMLKLKQSLAISNDFLPILCYFPSNTEYVPTKKPAIAQVNQIGPLTMAAAAQPLAPIALSPNLTQSAPELINTRFKVL